MNYTLLVPAFALLFACGGESKTKSASASTAAVADLTGINAPAGVDAGKCLLTYQTKMDEALPLATIKKHFTGDMSKAELKYRKSEKYPNHDTYSYTWPSGKKKDQQVMGRTFSIPLEYQIGLAWIEEINPKYNPDPVKAFHQMYHTPTPEELKRAKEFMDKQLEKRLKEKGMTSSTEKKAANDVAGSVINRKIEFQKIDGLGDGASWSVPDNELHVLAGYTKFRIIANAGEDNAANLTLAKKLAADVLAKCR